MECHIGLQSEFVDICVKDDIPIWNEKYADGWSGVSIFETQQAWVFVDKIARFFDLLSYVMDAIVATTVHELIHLCVDCDESVALRGESLLAWDGWSWCYRPLPMISGD